ncbi:RidA family protein [Mesorhizobium carmichaelinearum]|uniref:RidA family protein n=1 Tax=Mesorhizobium carmichaelinearum TaxID=1208188 RepID=UPI000BA3F0F8|nr:Rid family detoxifying hydrolase [Mesorhizobium carmichaelinearum]
MPRKAYNLNSAASVGPYSHAVEANGFIHLSGQTPLDTITGKLIEGDISAQTAQCFGNLFAVLAETGLTADDVVTCSVYLTDMKDFPAMNAVYERQFSKPFPARTTIGVASLPLGAKVEIGLIAARR